jgi:hypothetical protein
MTTRELRWSFIGYASPSNTASARWTASITSWLSWPMVGPSLARRTVCGRSTAICEGTVRPFSSVGATSIRVTAAFRRLLVSGNTTTVGSASNQSAWMTTAKRGLPLSPCKATTTISPRRVSRGHSRRRRLLFPRSLFRTGPRPSSRRLRSPRIGAGIPPRSQGHGCQEPKFGLAAGQRRAFCRVGA